jgi:hypothetical protein
MKRLIALPAAVLTASLVFAACAGSDASVQPGDGSLAITTTVAATTAPTTSITPLIPPATDATTTVPATAAPAVTLAPTTSVKKPTATTVKPPTTTVKPTGSTEQLAQQAATSFANALDDAAREGDRAPIYKTIWNQYASAGLTISIPPLNRSTENPSGQPSFSTLYQVTGNGQTYCLIWDGGSSYVTKSGAC